MPDKIKFGTDGWRGIIDVDVTNKRVASAAQAFAEYLIHHSTEKDIVKAAVAYDGRTHSKPWALLFARVLSGNNIKVYLNDRTGPTPVLSYAVKAMKLNAGAMITASHNTSEYNGIKFKSSYGGPFSTSQTLEVESLLGKELVQADDEKIFQTDLRAVYLDHLEQQIDFEAIKKSGLKLLIDSMAGAGQQIIETLLLKHGIPCKTIFKIAEKDFAGRIPEPAEKNLKPLYEEITKGDYSLGAATDGDADRVAIMLDTGELLSSQELILLLTDYLINEKHNKGDIVKTAAVTEKLKLHFENSNRKVIEVPVGFKNICELMIEKDIVFGCEESGGFGFKNHMPDKDGIFTALIAAEMLAKSGYLKMSDYVAEKRKSFGEIFFKRNDIKSTNEKNGGLFAQLIKNPPDKIGSSNIASYKAYYSRPGEVNGIKFTFDGESRWLLLRNSETENCIRIYAESTSENDLNYLIESGKEFLQNVNYIST